MPLDDEPLQRILWILSKLCDFDLNSKNYVESSNWIVRAELKKDRRVLMRLKHIAQSGILASEDAKNLLALFKQDSEATLDTKENNRRKMAYRGTKAFITILID